MEAKDHRLRAREALQGKWVIAVLVTLVASLVGATGSSSNISNFEQNSTSGGSVPIDDSFLPLIATIAGGAILVALVMLVISVVIGSVVRLGHVKFYLKLIDREEVTMEQGFATLFSEFSRYGQAVVLNLMTMLFIFLWTLCLVIPGIIATYSYAMAPYIMAEDLGCTGREAITRSKELMNGHKLELFVLDFTFIGWDILAALTLGLGYLALNPYKEAARASFYRNLTRGADPAPFADEPLL